MRKTKIQVLAFKNVYTLKLIVAKNKLCFIHSNVIVKYDKNIF